MTEQGAIEEAELLAHARSGNADAFSELLEAHRRGMRAHCYRLLGSVDAAKEAVQQAGSHSGSAVARASG